MSVLKVTYGVQRPLRMDYNRMLFGMQMPDATAWAQVGCLVWGGVVRGWCVDMQVLKQTESLTMLDLSGNLIDDDMTRLV